MTNYQFRCHEMFVRVRGFGQSHGYLFPPGSPGAEQSVKRQREARGESVAVRAGYRDAFRRGFDAVLTLDIVMANTHQHDDVAVATWKATRRVEKSAPSRRKRIVA